MGNAVLTYFESRWSWYTIPLSSDCKAAPWCLSLLSLSFISCLLLWLSLTIKGHWFTKHLNFINKVLLWDDEVNWELHRRKRRLDGVWCMYGPVQWIACLQLCSSGAVFPVVASYSLLLFPVVLSCVSLSGLCPAACLSVHLCHSQKDGHTRLEQKSSYLPSSLWQQ